MSNRVKIEFKDTVAYVTLNRPDKHNGMDMDMLNSVVAAQKTVKRNKSVRAVIISGEGPSLCAGLDFKSVMGNSSSRLWAVMQLLLPWRNRFQEWSMGWRNLPVPVIALMHGNCFGAGLQLALGADIRISRPDAKLSLMEAKWGLVPDMGGIALARELMPIDVVKELTMTGRVISGEDGKALNLVTHLNDDPLSQAQELVAEISTRSPDAVGAGKFLLQNAWMANDYRALKKERGWQRRVIGRKNQQISVKRNLTQSDTPFVERTV